MAKALDSPYAAGSRESFNDLIPIVYAELKAIAGSQLRRSGMSSEFDTTMLVHEAYEKLVQGQTLSANDRRHFFAIASRAMRQVVVDAYRARNATKRGGGELPTPLTTGLLVDLDSPERLLMFDQALQQLAEANQALAEVVELSCFGGLSNADIAELTGTNVRTVQRQLVRAQAWIGEFVSQSGT